MIWWIVGFYILIGIISFLVSINTDQIKVENWFGILAWLIIWPLFLWFIYKVSKDNGKDRGFF